MLVRSVSTHRRPADGCVVETSGDGLGFLTVVADGMPSTPLSAGERVDAVVGDDVEAVLALDDVGHGPKR